MLCRHQCDHLWEGYSDVVQTSEWPSLGRVQGCCADISVAIFGKGTVMLCRHQCGHLWEGTVMLCRHQCGHLWEGYNDVVQTSV